MKIILPAKPLLFKTIFFITCFILVTSGNRSNAANTLKGSYNPNRVAINFVHDVNKNETKVQVKSGTESIMQLFIFSAEGILIEEVAVSIHAITTIRGLKNGYYFYECFKKDERMKSGSLLIK
ncbi:MAG: hypothetical protein ABIS01_13510 [Ferruginibacter sp.]